MTRINSASGVVTKVARSYLTALLLFAVSSNGMAAVLEEIVVTAQKREASLQDVPMSISAISGDQLEERNITEWRDLQIPGVYIGEAGDTRAQFIRGVGTVPLERGFEMAVPIYYDGVYSGRGRHNALGLWDIENIEVLKGPQPTHVGKNAIGGAILVRSAQPTDEFSSKVGVTYEAEAEELVLDGAVSGPLTDQLSARLAVKYRSMEGWGVNIANGRQKVPQHDDIRLRGSFLFDATENLEIIARVEYADLEQTGGVRSRFNCSPMAPLDPAVGGHCEKDEIVTMGFDPDTAPIGFFPTSRNNQKPLRIALEHKGGSVQVNWDFDNFLLTSITGYYEYDSQVFVKPDFNTAAIPILIADSPEEFEQFSQEIRLVSTTDGPVEWLAGAYFDTSELEAAGHVAIPPAGIAFSDSLAVDQDSWAVFGELIYHFNEQFTARLGARYSDVSKDGVLDHDFWFITPGNALIDSVTAIGIDLNYVLDESRSDSDFQPALTLEWAPRDNAMYYVSWKEGFKAGGFAISGTPPSGAFEPETVTAWEVGVKYTLFNEAATLNLALFRSDFEDLQVSTFNPATGLFLTRNAEESRSQGLEFQFAWAATDEWSLNVSGLFLDAEYIDFSGVNCFLNPPQTAAQGCDFSTDPPTTNLGGQPLSYSPEFSATVSLDYDRPVFDGLFFRSSLGVFYTDEFHITSRGDKDVYQDSYSTIDLRLSIGSDDGQWEVAFFGKNLTDEITAHMIEDTPGDPNSNWANIDRLRQLGAQLTVSW